VAVRVIRIAHVSDPHVLSRTAAEWRSIVFNKRVTGYANLLLRRGRVHRREYLLSVFAEAAEQSDPLDHPNSAIRAGFNLYVVDDSGSLTSVDAHVLDPVRGGFEKRCIDRVATCG
jgi:hypothetical protein